MKTVSNMVSNINRKKLRNNTQRVLLSLLSAKGGWVARTQIRVPSVGARLRDLRKEEFGGFDVQCVTATELRKSNTTRATRRLTFYRLNPRSVTVDRVAKVLEGVVTK